MAEEIKRLAEPLTRTAEDSVRVLAGELGLGGTAALLAAADVVVANDSGPRHLAQAVGSSTVGVFWLGNVITAAPLTRLRHRVHLSSSPGARSRNRHNPGRLDGAAMRTRRLAGRGWPSARCWPTPGSCSGTGVAAVPPRRIALFHRVDPGSWR